MRVDEARVVDAPEAVIPQVRLTEIFRSLQGESGSVGWPTVFVRLTGCPLRCVYCDTAYAFTGGQRYPIDEIMDQVAAHRTRHVCVTGGEPLAQPGCLPLLTALCDQGFSVSLETSGAMAIEDVDSRVRLVMDLKAPSSGESARNLMKNLDYLKPTDEIKIVIGSVEDFRWAEQVIVEYGLDERFDVLVSPVFGAVSPQALAEWVLGSERRMRYQFQLHKLIWGNEPGH
ncbi:7-carboxy-7-deazaguanine synthase QueE [Halothiobacillus diazotrophicus]|uniref:7-carboxy-7-deazaguanine synthase n=1 Tax=Halothiobacillus diazotrophicus TaxID=1860122 RepID=A0A191ZIC0_9GAMM|nr:7-carboxy-7-deazaguanine synthase QueE [Halothiobacillus diazotrophicus]ANJ67641.1 7-carboxy-7-deazaguanine synthase QueE [Halothiobacillus diazotrophicus]